MSFSSNSHYGAVRNLLLDVGNLFRIQFIGFFRRYVELACQEHRLNWECIELSKRYFSLFLEKDDRVACMHTEFVFSLFEKFRCQDKHLIKYWLTEYTKQWLINRGYYNEGRRCVAVQEPRFHYMANDMDIDKLLLKPFVLEDIKAMSRLLRYEIVNQQNIDTGALGCYIYEVIASLFSNRQLRGLSPCLSVLGSIYRTNLIALGMNAVARKMNRELYFNDFIQSFKLLFKSVPEPFITLPEVKRVIEWGLEEDESSRNDMEKFCALFASEFPKSTEPLQPRSLRHLSRCEIRKSLRKAMELPHGVWRLQIPRQMANYILMQKSEKDFYPETGYPIDEIPFRHA